MWRGESQYAHNMDNTNYKRSAADSARSQRKWRKRTSEKMFIVIFPDLET